MIWQKKLPAVAAVACLVASTTWPNGARALDISGVYDAEISGQRTQAVYRKSRRFQVRLVQQGNKVLGTFADLGGEIEGTITGNRIKFRWFSGTGSGGGQGNWKIVSGGDEIVGTWADGWRGSGAWNLSRVEPLTAARSGDAGGSGGASLSELAGDRLLQVASGSGFAVSAQGHIVTNDHVIDGCNRVDVHVQGRSIPTRLLYRDPVNDLAVLQGDFAPAQVFALSRRNPSIMQEIYVAGYPFGADISTSIKVTKGIVSSLAGIGNNISNIQIDAALQPGNSGGPIFDEQGNVIAVAVAKLDFKQAIKDWGVVPENINFGIKSNVVVNLLESNGIPIRESSMAPITRAELGAVMNGATFYLSCWMTPARLKQVIESKKVYENLE